MLTWLVTTSLRLRVVVLSLAAVLMVFGINAIEDTPLDVFPEFAPPYVEVQTEAPGMSTEEVENFVTIPLEGALNGTAGVKTIRSKSVLGQSQVVLIFEPGTDLKTARQLVQERLAVEASRPQWSAHPPVMLQPLSSMSRLMKIGVTSKTLDQKDMTVLALWTIRPKLMSVPGVANVAIWGQRDKQFQVKVNPDRLRAHGVTLDAVMKAAGEATVLESGGFIDTPNNRLAVRHVPTIDTKEDLERRVIPGTGGKGPGGTRMLRIGDVAEVVIGSPPPIGDA